MKPLMTEIEVVAALNTSRSTLRRMWRDGVLPKPHRLGKRGIRWRTEDIENHIANSSRVSLKQLEGVVQ